ncbi:MAG: pilus assembly protein [Bacilli bacterium]|nr:pilus assembly protein [Bacilli bacterium]
MLGRKGQVLVEFILIFPILVMLLFAVVDFGRIFVNQSELETALGIINDIDRESINEQVLYDEINKNTKNKINVSITNEEDGYINIILTRKINIITPGLNLILSSPYEIKTSRVVKYGQ